MHDLWKLKLLRNHLFFHHSHKGAKYTWWGKGWLNIPGGGRGSNILGGRGGVKDFESVISGKDIFPEVIHFFHTLKNTI